MRSHIFRQDLILACLLITVIALMVIPLPQALIDALIGINITLSVLLLMVAIYLKHPSDFSTFPSVILLGTAFRLAISIATTRMILTEADAGQIIDTFGSFVISGNLVVGLVIFLIITIVQFIVITKGSERVAEVAARFCLDAMPGKQMSIDAEVRAGTIDSEEGKIKRQKLDKDNQFFGAMDGAMKFVKGDAIAGIVITAVNLIGGIVVGMAIHGYTIGRSLEVYSLLTIGDGLVAQIPALFMSMSAAAIITRVTHSESSDLGSEISSQITSDQRAVFVAAAASFAFMFVPGFPWIVFLTLSMGLLSIGLYIRNQKLNRERELEEELTQQEESEQETVEETNELAPPPLRVTDRHVLRVGKGLFNAIERDKGQEYRDTLYRHWISQSGISFPAFSIIQDSNLKEWEMSIDFDAVPAFKHNFNSDCRFLQTTSTINDLLPEGSMRTGNNWPSEEGFWIPTTDGLDPELKKNTTPIGQAIMLPSFRIAEKFAGQLFSRVELGYFLQGIEEKDPSMVNELAEKITISNLHDILRRLIQDGVPLKPQRLVLETLYQWMIKTDDLSILTEAVRAALRRQICFSLADENGILTGIIIEPSIENEIRNIMKSSSYTPESGAGDAISLPPHISEQILHEFYNLQSSKVDTKRRLVVITSSDIRKTLRNFLAINNIHYPVISYQEISAEVRAHPIAMIRLKKEDMNKGKAA